LEGIVQRLKQQQNCHLTVPSDLGPWFCHRRCPGFDFCFVVSVQRLLVDLIDELPMGLFSTAMAMLPNTSWLQWKMLTNTSCGFHDNVEEYSVVARGLF